VATGRTVPFVAELFGWVLLSTSSIPFCSRQANCVTLPCVPDQTTLSISIINSETIGIPTAVCRRADGHEFFLHSRQDPQQEARLLIKDVPCRERTLYAVLGFGLGYHVRELLQRIPQSSHIIVVEPASACLSSGLRSQKNNQAWKWMSNSRLHFLSPHDAGVVPLALVDRMAALRLLALELFTHVPSTLTAEDFYRSLRSEIPRQFPVSFQSRVASLDTMLENHLRNFWANLPHSWNAAPMQNLQGKWPGRRLIIVSSGPSLTDALPSLRAAGGSALLLVAGSAARILMANQIPPDLVVAMDPFEANLAHFQGWDGSGIPLLYHHQIHRDILTAYAGPRFFFIMQNDPPVPLRGCQDKSGFRQGGSVAFSALQLAHYLGANPIIFVGQDFAFRGGHTHAGGSLFDQTFDAEALPTDYLRVPGVDGNPVVTNRIYYSYLLYMQDYLLDFESRNPDIKHLNASRTGARIQGMDSVALEQALAGPGGNDLVSPSDMIHAALGQSRSVRIEAQRAALDKWAGASDRLLKRADQFSDFGSLFAVFKTTPLYAQAPRIYDDIYYLFETKYCSPEAAATPSFLNRFLKHLQFVSQELNKMGSSVGALRT
jgi:hypothetical protein